MENKLVVYGLIVQAMVLSYLLLQAEKRVSFLEGQKAGTTITVTETDGLFNGPYPSKIKNK